MTRSLFSLKPPLAGRPSDSNPAQRGPQHAGVPNGGPSPGEGGGEPLPEDLVSKLKSATTTLPATVQPGQVRAIRSNQLVKVLSEAMAPERRRFEEELSRSRQRSRDLEAELERLREAHKGVDETRRTELPRLAALVDQERTRVEELESERDSLSSKIAALQEELTRREAVATAALPVEGEAAVDDVLAGVQQRLDAIATATADTPVTSLRPDAPPPAPAAQVATPAAAPPATAAAGATSQDVERLVGALLSSDARSSRLATLEQRVAELTGQPAPPPAAADEPTPAARAVAALVRATLDEARFRAERLEAKVGELVDIARGLHGALGEEARRRAVVEGALRAAQARLSVLEQREPGGVRLPSLTHVVRGDVGPVLDAMREESRRRDDQLDARVHRLGLATRAALERMAEILDQALVAGLFDRDLPRVDVEALGASIADAVSGARPRPLWRDPVLDELDEDEDEDGDEDEDDRDDEGPDDDGPGPRGGPAPREREEVEDPGSSLLRRDEPTAQAKRPVVIDPWRNQVRDDDAASEERRGALARPPEPADDAFVDELGPDDDEPPATEEELRAWFRPGRPGQSDDERETEQLEQFDLEPPPAPPETLAALEARARARDPTPPPPAPVDPGATDLGQLEGLNREHEQALKAQAELEAERRRLEQRVRDAERALESEVWRGLATHRELVTTKQKLEQLEKDRQQPVEQPPAPAPTLGGFEPIADLGPLRDEAVQLQAEKAAVLTLDVEDRDSWVHWLLLEQDVFFRGTRARAARVCADAVRGRELDEPERKAELLHWLAADDDASA